MKPPKRTRHPMPKRFNIGCRVTGGLGRSRCAAADPARPCTGWRRSPGHSGCGLGNGGLSEASASCPRPLEGPQRLRNVAAMSAVRRRRLLPSGFLSSSPRRRASPHIPINKRRRRRRTPVTTRSNQSLRRFGNSLLSTSPSTGNSLESDEKPPLPRPPRNETPPPRGSTEIGTRLLEAEWVSVRCCPARCRYHPRGVLSGRIAVKAAA